MALTAIGKYRVLGELGRGAMGTVFLAEDPHIGRCVAIKVMRPQADEGSERFLQEARTVGSLSHPNIVLLHDFGFEGELPYLVMERVDGTVLDRWLAGPRREAERLRVLAGLCRAVVYAHGRGVLHRDLKPSNVIVRDDGEAKLLDFGIARAQDTRMTATGIVLGTPEYLAPELLAGTAFAPRSDVYALGLVAYEIFGGRNPFRAETLAACLRRVLEVEPEPLPPAGGASRELATEIMACIARDPALRPAGAERLLAAVERQLAGHAGPATVAVAAGVAATYPQPRRRTRRALAGVAAAVAVAVVLALWLLPAGARPGHRSRAGDLVSRLVTATGRASSGGRRAASRNTRRGDRGGTPGGSRGTPFDSRRGPRRGRSHAPRLRPAAGRRRPRQPRRPRRPRAATRRRNAALPDIRWTTARMPEDRNNRRPDGRVPAGNHGGRGVTTGSVV